ncbi:hypothetical protein RclHR1_19030002 [Rhizophagus clarus]|nr:hypothetical protein RclHR1_19030002 [Rhizophagus clarus]GET03182.1 hypothetical protein GLOIN_2v425278 [Rhizophagus clarus]
MIKAHHYTKTVYPSHCSKRHTKTVTVTSTDAETTISPTTTTTTTTTTSITTTTTTTTSFVPPTPAAVQKRHERCDKITCVPDKHKHYIYKHGKCTEISYCTPTVHKPCPRDKTTTKTVLTTSTFTSTSTSTDTSTSTATSTSTSILVIPTCRATSSPCNINNFLECCNQCCFFPTHDANNGICCPFL